MERGLDGGGDELRGLRVDDDVPAEQYAADDLPGVRGHVVRADGGGGGTGGIGLGHTRTVEETVLARLLDTPDLQRLLRRSPGSAYPVRGSAGDRVANRSIYNTRHAEGNQSRSLAACAPARRIAAEAIRAEAEVKNNPADLINVALEKVLQATLELPAYRTLDELASQIRKEVNREIFTRVHDRMNLYERGRLEASLSTIGLDGKTLFNAFKQTARRPSWSHFRQLARHLAFVDGYGDTERITA